MLVGSWFLCLIFGLAFSLLSSAQAGRHAGPIPAYQGHGVLGHGIKAESKPPLKSLLVDVSATSLVAEEALLARTGSAAAELTRVMKAKRKVKAENFRVANIFAGNIVERGVPGKMMGITGLLCGIDLFSALFCGLESTYCAVFGSE
ncbi:hypothetical protein BC939DRAFT_481040 [Gamsiella multidivaricata]|uniref:uncharacterized protein n=1 Tax=Gamsiella multidivaricata TaxID=101098 RepID=UPI0022207335|nr:uncharacterized protein BC939DRAFT_481040 [Gamsiella multidivaricata]KAI7817565.1 hypothetical protein BC939DRAFT_481040 [Gamsiella multidivaricata]